MPWRCPACRAEIHYYPAGPSFPDPHVKYRCHVCRLDLRFDPVLRRMEIAPFDVDSHEESASRKGTDLEG
jgi:hypothetical protein